MRTKNYAGRILAAMCALVVIGCVDNSYNLDNMSTEVTIGQETMTIPLGYFDDKSLGELIGDEEIEGLKKDEDGNYSLVVDGEVGRVEIDGISTHFDIPQTENRFKVVYPSFDFDMEGVVIDLESDVNVNSGALDAFTNLPGVSGDNYYLPEGIALPKISGEFSEIFTSDDLHLVMDLPEQVKDIHKIIFKDIEGNHHGAPLHLNLALNDLAGINGGGKLWFDLKIEGGKFNILNSQNELIYSGTHYKAEYPIASGAEDVDFAIYVESIINEVHPDSNHHIDIPISMSYDMQFEIETKPGHFGLEDMPHISLFADFEFGDAEIVMDGNVSLLEYHPDGGVDSNVNVEFPEVVKSISRIELVDGSEFEFFAHGLGWLGDVADDVEVVAKLPDYLVLHAKPNAGYKFDERTHELMTTISKLDEGVVIEIEAMDFGAEGITPDANGNLSIGFAPDITAHFATESDIKVSSLKHDGEVEIVVGMSQSNLSVVAVSGKVDYGYDIDESFDIAGLEDIDLEIEGVGLRPVIEVEIGNSLSVEALISGRVIPVKDGVELAEYSINIEDVKVAAATYANGDVKPQRTRLIIADESLRDTYEGGDCTFVASDVAKLVEGGIPEQCKVDMEVRVDDSTIQTLYLADKFEIEYDFGLNMPLAFDNNLNITYESVAEGIGDVFEELVIDKVKVGDIAVIAEVRNTIPLSFGAEIELLNADGNPTAARLRIPEGSVVRGSKDGKSAEVSELRLELELAGEGEISQLSEVEAIGIKLNAQGVSQTPVPLNEKQTLGATLRLELTGGITLDLKLAE